MDPFIDTAILAEQTIKNAARLRDTTLKALAQKTWWRISQTLPPDFYLVLDLDSLPGVPLLNVIIPTNGYTWRVQLPADKADPYAVSDLYKHVCLDGPVETVSADTTDPAKDVLLYNETKNELEGRIELK